MKKKEKVQFRALRYIYSDFSSTYQELGKKSGKLLLHVQRLRLLAIQVYKIVNETGPKYLHNLFNVKKSPYETKAVIPLIRPKFKANMEIVQ